MLIRRPPDILPSEITPESVYLDRRRFIAAATAAAAGLALPRLARALESGGADDDQLTPYKDVTTYNNYYEFGT
ncbi:MAG: protein-methionine-sulfoxide reductase catalytic subunit MsrP, partial [Gemmatimonadales bacterium]